MPSSRPQIHLDHAPLVLVLAQARFSFRPDLDAHVPAFRQACEKLGYPLFRPGRIRTLNIGGSGPLEASDAPRWDFLDKSQCWNAVLAPEFLLLQTTRYTDFKEFLGRWKDLLEAAKVLSIPVVERLGLRYVDLVRPAPGERLSEYLRPALAGWDPREGSNLRRTNHLAITAFDSTVGQMLVRVQPATTQVPPDLESPHLKGLTQPAPGDAFVDFDHSSSDPVDFEPGIVAKTTRALHDVHDDLFLEVITEKAKSVWGWREVE
jgi:uncharacterized protein (TIGR04255 family)